MATAAQRRSRVTVIDDHPEFLELMCELLSTDYDVTALLGATLTPDDILDSRPDLLIVNLGLDRGEVQGWDMVTVARAHRALRATPVVVCSADPHGLKVRAEGVLNTGNTAVLAKPFELDHLERVVRRGLIAGFPGGRLAESEAGYRSLFSGSTDAILVTDESGRYLDANDVALDLLGLTRDGLRRLSVADVVATERVWTDAEWERYRSDGWWHGSVRLSLPGNRTQLMLATARMVPNGNHSEFVSWLHPVEAARQA